MHGETYGFEMAAEVELFPGWRLKGAYTYLRMELHLDDESTDLINELAEGQSPHHQVSVRSALDLPRNVELDLWIRYVDHLPALDVGSYTTLDARVSWRPVESVELSLVGQNLLEDRHLEFRPEVFSPFQPAEVERGLYGKVTCRF